MQGTIVQIKIDGTRWVTEVTGKPKLEDLKAAIGGGFLELVPFFDTYEHGDKIVKCIAYCDEHGKMNKLPINKEATILWERALSRTGRSLLSPEGQILDILVGPICIVFGDADFMRNQ
jgi:hypothetical protein